MDVLAILPGCFLELSCVTDLRAFGYKMMLEIGPSDSEIIVPIKTPNNPTRLLDAKDVIRQVLSFRDFMN